MSFASNDLGDIAHTKSFISYLISLFEQNVLDIQSLENFIIHLQKSDWINPISDLDAKSNPTSNIHHYAIEDFIKDSNLIKSEIIEHLSKLVFKEKKGETLKTKSTIRTKELVFPITFKKLRMNKSTFIEVMSAPVTEYQWAKVMRDFQVPNSQNETREFVQIDGKEYFLKPNLPIIDRTFWDALRFANELSLQHSYFPIYNLEHLYSGYIENGRLVANGFVSSNKSSKRDLNKQGYRLPNSQEFSFLVHNVLEHIKIPKNKKKILLFLDKSNSELRYLSIMPAVYVQNQKFYIQLGFNYREWVIEPPLEHKANQEATFGILNMALNKTHENSNNPLGFPIGFRLVRTISKEEYTESLK